MISIFTRRDLRGRGKLLTRRSFRLSASVNTRRFRVLILFFASRLSGRFKLTTELLIEKEEISVGINGLYSGLVFGRGGRYFVLDRRF